MTQRTLRYVELDAAGRPFHENVSSWEDGPTENEAWAQLVIDAAAKGNTLVRLADGRYASNPKLTDIEGDGRGGFRPRAGATLLNVEVMPDA